MKNKLLSYQSLNTDMAALLLRLILGGLFIYHGYTKLMAYGQILPHFTDLIGIGSKLSFNLVIFAELICGFLVTIGLATRLAVIPIFITMVVAFFIALGQATFNVRELALVFLLLSGVIFMLGSGRYSVDKMIRSKQSPS